MLNKIRKQQIGDKEYSFKMTNKTIRKIDEKYGNYGSIIYGLMEGEQFYTNSLKLISMCCINKEKIFINKEENKYREKAKEWDIEELEDIITGKQYQEITNLALELYLDYMGLNEKNDKEKVKNEKN